MSDSFESEFLDELFTLLRKDKLVLPSLPEIALQVKDILSDEDKSLADVANLLSKDPALSARLIQIANSPLLRTANPIKTVNMAVMKMGSNMLKNIVTSIVMEQMFRSENGVINLKLRECWKHASEVSTIALQYADLCPYLHKDQIMLAGLVHNIGALPIISMAETRPELTENTATLEHIIDKAHSKIGTAILDLWNFPEELVKVTMHYTDLTYNSGKKVDYAELIQVANLQSKRNTEAFRTLENLEEIAAFNKLEIIEHVEYL